MSFFDRFWPRWTDRLKYACQVLFTGNIYVGRGTEWPGCPDFLLTFENINTQDDDYLWAGEGLLTRKLILGDKGDAVDLALRRAGPDGSSDTDQNATNLEHNAR